MSKQPVSLGVSQSGKPGLFTNGMMAWPLSPEEYAAFENNRVALRVYCEKLDFQLAPRPLPEDCVFETVYNRDAGHLIPLYIAVLPPTR